MAGSEVTCISGGIINADVSISPGNTITGFGPCVITGVQNLANAGMAGTAVGDQAVRLARAFPVSQVPGFAAGDRYGDHQLMAIERYC